MQTFALVSNSETQKLTLVTIKGIVLKHRLMPFLASLA